MGAISLLRQKVVVDQVVAGITTVQLVQQGIRLAQHHLKEIMVEMLLLHHLTEVVVAVAQVQ